SGRASRFWGQNGNVDRFSDHRLSVEISVKISRSQIACPDSGSGLILNDLPLQIFLRGYFVFQVNAFTGWNSASASVTQPYFFFRASKTLLAVPLFMSRNTAFPSSIAWRFEPSASIMVIAGFSLRFR